MRAIKLAERVRFYGELPGLTDEDAKKYDGQAATVVGLTVGKTTRHLTLKFKDGETWDVHRRQCVPLKKKTAVRISNDALRAAWDKCVAHTSELEVSSVSPRFKLFAAELGIQKNSNHEN